MIIDFHTHTFPVKLAPRAIAALSRSANMRPCTDGTDGGILQSMKKAGVDCSVILPVATNPAQVSSINTGLIETEENKTKALCRFGAMHPNCETYKQELKLLAEHHIPGIKLHPAFQGTDLNDIRMLRILDYASELGLITVIHGGMDIGFPNHNYSSIEMQLQVLREVEPQKLVVAHMGSWNGWQDVEHYLAGAPVWLDTALSIGSVYASAAMGGEKRFDNLQEADFIRLCRKHGTDRILFGTDSPWAEQSEYTGRLSEMALTDAERTAILGGNAEKLLGCRNKTII